MGQAQGHSGLRQVPQAAQAAEEVDLIRHDGQRLPVLAGYGDPGPAEDLAAAAGGASAAASDVTHSDWHAFRIGLVSGVAIWIVTNALDRVFLGRRR